MESSKSDSESPDQAEFRGDNKCAQCMQVLYLQSEQVNGIHNLEDIQLYIYRAAQALPQYIVATFAATRALARMPDLVSEVDSDRRAAIDRLSSTGTIVQLYRSGILD